MIYARLQVGEPVADRSAAPFVNPGTYRAPLRINGRLSVLDDSITRRAFDTVQLYLRGIVATSIGYKTALEDIITLTDIKAATDFRLTSQNDEGDAQDGRHLDFYFELPTNMSTADGIVRPLPLSATFKGTVNLNQNSPLNENSVIHGGCEVSYWIEVKFRRAGQQVGLLQRHIKVRSLYPHLRASLSRATPLTIRAKPDILTRCRIQKTPDLSLTLSDTEMTLECDANTGKRRITLPLAVAMTTSDAFSIQPRQSLTCVVEAKWQLNTRFSTLSSRKGSDRLGVGETVHMTTTMSTQKCKIFFRPLPQYDDNDVRRCKAAGPFLATSQLDLPVPDAVCQPSLNWNHLSRTYNVILSLQFHCGQGAPNYSLNATLPLSVSAYGSKADDAVLGVMELDCLEAASDSDEADDLLITLGSLSIGRGDRQRAAVRTPPPPYFR